MVKKNYYCLVAGLPDLVLNEERPALTSLQFRLDMAKELTPPDYQLLEWIYRPYDNQNLINLLLQNNVEFNELGNYPAEYLKEQIQEPVSIAPYLKSLIGDFHSGWFDRTLFNLEQNLNERFFESVLETGNSFIRQWFTFDRNLKNILTAFNCHKFNYPARQHLVLAGSSADLQEIFFKENIRPEAFTDEDIPYLEQIFHIAGSDAQATEKEKAIDHIRFTFADDLTVFNYFTIEKILAFAIKLLIVDRWRKLDDETGKIFLARLVNDLETSYSFADTFSLTKRR
jgi:hypothetical protein